MGLLSRLEAWSHQEDHRPADQTSRRTARTVPPRPRTREPISARTSAAPAPRPRDAERRRSGGGPTSTRLTRGQGRAGRAALYQVVGPSLRTW